MMEKNNMLPAKYDVNAKWDAFLDLIVRRFVYSSLVGTFSTLLLFRMAFGTGSAIAQRAVESVMGPRKVFDEMPERNVVTYSRLDLGSSGEDAVIIS